MGKFGQDAGVTHSYSFSKGILGLLKTTESQDLGLTSHPKDGAFYSIVSPSLYLGVRTHRPQGEHPLLASLIPLPLPLPSTRHRGYYVSIGEHKSKWTSMTRRVPQDLNLAPLLFSLYMRPLSQIMREAIWFHHSYADDTQVNPGLPSLITK